MKRFLAVLALSSVVAAPTFAADDSSDLSCSDFMGMEAAERTQKLAQMNLPTDSMESSVKSETAGTMSADEMGGEDDTHSGVMSTDTLVADVEEACSAHSDSSVTEALEMMTDS